jgi:lambda repressor-like predicted transcriptional regulator
MITDKATSLEFLQAVYCNDQLPLSTRMRAAIAALPFEVPKLAVTAVVSEQDFATLLDRRLKRIEEMKAKAIEATPQAALPRLDDRRYRRL